MASNGSSRTPFDDDLTHDPGAPKGTQPLPAFTPRGAQPIRPSRLLPPPAGSPPTPYAGVTPITPPTPSGVPSAGLTPAPPHHTSPLSLKRTPLSTVIGLSMAGGAVAVLLISAVVRGVVQRTLSVTNPPATVPVVAQPTPLNSELMPTPGAAENSGSPTTDAQQPADIAPDTPKTDSAVSRSTLVPQPGKHPSAATTQHGASTIDPAASDDKASAPQDADPAPTILPENKAATGQPASQVASPDDSATAGATVAQPFTHRRAGYAITPPAGFKLIKRGQRTIWQGPDGATLLVETTARPGRTPFGDWLRLDAMLRLKYGKHYRSHGINETTLAGLPAAMWDFELDEKAGPIRKLDVAVHGNGRGYAILGSAPLLKFDAARAALESAIHSFDLTQPTVPPPIRHRRSHPDAASSDQSGDKASLGGGQPNEDLRPDAGY